MDTDTYIKKIAEDIIWICNNHDITEQEWQNEILSRVEDIKSRIARLPAKIKRNPLNMTGDEDPNAIL